MLSLAPDCAFPESQSGEREMGAVATRREFFKRTECHPAFFVDLAVQRMPSSGAA